MDLDKSWLVINPQILPDLMQSFSTAGNMFKSNNSKNKKVNLKGSKTGGGGKGPNENPKTKRSRSAMSSDPNASKVKGHTVTDHDAVLCTNYVKLDTSFLSFTSPEAKVRKVSDFGSPVRKKEQEKYKKSIPFTSPTAKVRRASNFGSPSSQNKENFEDFETSAMETGIAFVEALSPTFEVEIPPTSPQNSFIEHSFSKPNKTGRHLDSGGVVGLRYQKIDENESMHEVFSERTLYDQKKMRSESLKNLHAFINENDCYRKNQRRSNSLRISRENDSNTSWEKSLADRGRKTLNFLTKKDDNFKVRKESDPKVRRKLLATKRSIATSSLQAFNSHSEDDTNTSNQSFVSNERVDACLVQMSKSTTPIKQEKEIDCSEGLAKELSVDNQQDSCALDKPLKKRKSATRLLRSEKSGVFNLGAKSTLRSINRQNASSRLQCAKPDNEDNIVAVAYRKTGTPRTRISLQGQGRVCPKLKRQERVEQSPTLKRPRKDSTGSAEGSNASSDKENKCNFKSDRLGLVSSSDPECNAKALEEIPNSKDDTDSDGKNLTPKASLTRQSSKRQKFCSGDNHQTCNSQISGNQASEKHDHNNTRTVQNRSQYSSPKADQNEQNSRNEIENNQGKSSSNNENVKMKHKSPKSNSIGKNCNAQAYQKGENSKTRTLEVKSCDNIQTSDNIQNLQTLSSNNQQTSPSLIKKSTGALITSLGQQTSISLNRSFEDHSNEILSKPKHIQRALEHVVYKPILNTYDYEGVLENQVTKPIEEIIDNSPLLSNVEPSICTVSSSNCDNSVETLYAPLEVSPGVAYKDRGNTPPPLEKHQRNSLDVNKGDLDTTKDQELAPVINFKGKAQRQEFHLQRQLSWVVRPLEENPKAYDLKQKGVHKRSYGRANSCPSLKEHNLKCTLCVCHTNSHYEDGLSSQVRLDHRQFNPGIGKSVGLIDRGPSLDLLGQNGGSKGNRVKGVSESDIPDSLRNSNLNFTQDCQKLPQGDKFADISTEDYVCLNSKQHFEEDESFSKVSNSDVSLIQESTGVGLSEIKTDQIRNTSIQNSNSFVLDYVEEFSGGDCWLSYHPELEEGPEWKKICADSADISHDHNVEGESITGSCAILDQGDDSSRQVGLKCKGDKMASLKRFLSPKKSSKEPKEPKEKGLLKPSRSLLRVNTGSKSGSSTSNPVLLAVSKKENSPEVPSPVSPGGVAVSYGSSPDASKGDPKFSLANGELRQPGSKGSGETNTKTSKLASKSSHSAPDKKSVHTSLFSRGDATRRSARETSAGEKDSGMQTFKRNDTTRHSLPVRSLSMSSASRSQHISAKLRSKFGSEILSASDKENKATGETKKQASVPDLNKKDSTLDKSYVDNEDDDQIWVKRETRSLGNQQNQSKDIEKTKRDIHVSSKTAQNVSTMCERKISETTSSRQRKISEPSTPSGKNRSNDTVGSKHPVAASEENLTLQQQPKTHRRIGRVQSHYHVRGNKSQSETDSNMWRTTSHQEVSTSPYKLDKRSSFDSNVSVFSEPDASNRPHSMEFDSELSDAEMMNSRCSLNSDADFAHADPKHPGIKMRSTSSSALSRSTSAAERPQHHSYSNEPDTKLSVFDRLSMPRKNKMLSAMSAPRLNETGIMRSKSAAGSRSKLSNADSASKLSAGTHRAVTAAKDTGKGSGSDGEKSSLSRSSSSSSIAPAGKEPSAASSRLSKANSTSKLSSSPSRTGSRSARPFSPEPRKTTGQRPFSPDPDKQKSKSRPFSPGPKEQKKPARPSPGARALSPEPGKSGDAAAKTRRPFSPEPKKERGRPFSPEPKKEVGFGRAFSPEPGKGPNRHLSPEAKKTSHGRAFSPEPKNARAFSPEPVKPKISRSASTAQTAKEKSEKSKKGKTSGDVGLQRSASSASARQPFVGNTVQKSASHHSVRDVIHESNPELSRTQPDIALKNASAKHKMVQEFLSDQADGHASESDSEIMQYTMGLEPKSHQSQPKPQPPVDKLQQVQRSASDLSLHLPKGKPHGAESIPFVPGVHHAPIIGGHLNRNRGHHGGIPQDAEQIHSKIMEIRRHLQLQQARRLTDRLIRGRVVTSIPEDIRESDFEESEAAAMLEMSSSVDIIPGSDLSKQGSGGEGEDGFRRKSDDVSSLLDNVNRNQDYVRQSSRTVRSVSTPNISSSIQYELIGGNAAETGLNIGVKMELDTSVTNESSSNRKNRLETGDSSDLPSKEHSQDETSNVVDTSNVLETKSMDVSYNTGINVKDNLPVSTTGLSHRNNDGEKKKINSRFPSQKKMPEFSKETFDNPSFEGIGETAVTDHSGDRVRKISSESMSDSDRSFGVRSRKNSSEWRQDNSDMRNSPIGVRNSPIGVRNSPIGMRNSPIGIPSGGKNTQNISKEDFESNLETHRSESREQGVDYFGNRSRKKSSESGNRLQKSSLESVKDNVSVRKDVDTDAATATKTTFVKMRHSTPRKTTWSAIGKRLSDPNMDQQQRYSDPNPDSKTWLDSPPASQSPIPVPEQEPTRPSRISLIDSFYLERRLVSPHTTSLQKLFGSSSQIDSQSESEVSLPMSTSGLHTRTAALKKNAFDGLSPDTLSNASSGSSSSRVCSPVSDKSGQVSSGLKASTKSSLSGGKGEHLSSHEDYIAEVLPEAPKVSPLRQNNSTSSGFNVSPENRQMAPPPVPVHRNLSFTLGQSASFGETGTPTRAPPVPPHRSLEVSPPVPPHQNIQVVSEESVKSNKKRQAPSAPSHRSSQGTPPVESPTPPPVPSHQNSPKEIFPPFRKRDVPVIAPPHLRAKLAQNQNFGLGDYDRALPLPPVPPHRSSSLDQSDASSESSSRSMPHYDEPPPVQSRRKIFFDGGKKSPAAYGAESSEEEANETIKSLASMDWQTAVTHLERNRSKSLPADVLQDQVEQLQRRLRGKTADVLQDQVEQLQQRLRSQNTSGIPDADDEQEVFEVLRNNTSPSRSKIGRRWSVQNSSMQDLLYGPQLNQDQDLDSSDVTPPKYHGKKHSASTQDIHDLDADSLHRQYAAAALSSLQSQRHDMSVSNPSVNQVNVRQKQSPQSVFNESQNSKQELDKSSNNNNTVTPHNRGGGIKSAFSTGFLNTIHRSSSSAKSSGRSSGSSKHVDKTGSDVTKTKPSQETSGRKLPNFLNKILSRKRSKKDKGDKYAYKRKDSSDVDPGADAEDEEEDENEISIVSQVREELVISPKCDSDDDDSDILAQELEPDSPNDTLREDITITESDPRNPDRGSFIEEQDGLIFFSFTNAARMSPVSTVSSELQQEMSKSDKTMDTTSDSGSEASMADSLGNRFKQVGIGLHEPIKFLKEIGESLESLSSAATASGSDSEHPFKTRVKLSRTESFRMPRRPKPEPDQKFVRGGVYRGSMPVVRRTPPGSKISPKKDIATVTQDDKRTGIIPQALDLNFIRSTLAQRTSENSSVPGKDGIDSGARRQLAMGSTKPAPSDRKLKKANTFTPEEVAKVAHHMQGMAKYSHDVTKYEQERQKPKTLEVVYRSQSESQSGAIDFDLPRPKSDFWPEQKSEETSAMRHTQRPRPKSDLGGAKVIGLATNKQEWRTQLMTQRSFNRQVSSELGADDETSMARGKLRRMSMPHPIKIRKAKRQMQALTRQKNMTLKRSHSAPDNLHIMRKSQSCTSLAESAGNSDDVYETMSLASRRSSQSTIAPIDDIFEDSCTFAEALWDHVTLDVDELAFRAGDVIEVTDMLDKDWWWGRIEDTEGWFPSTFVRLRVNQTDTADDIAVKMREGAIDTSTAMQQVTSGFISKDQARANVINEIITVERIYVKHLLDLIEGYVKHARKRPEMFSKDRIATIFGNLEQVYAFSYKFLQSLESHIVRDAPHKSEIGQCFLEFVQGFEIYSEYCNNHPYGLCELQMLRCDPKFTQFFEACRLLQGMNEIPLEGFLLTPVQKVCKYPLQLAELLKHSRPEHPDYKKTNQALEAMKGIASLINERKRRMESMEKIALWQTMVESWEGQDLLELSSELIHTGELHKYNLNTNGWVKDRVFFLFDHQLVYCKRDLLKRDGLTYKGRMVMDCSEITSVADGRDTQFNLTVKNAWKVFDRRRDKWFLLCAKTAEEKTKWLNAFRKERKRVKEDRHSGFAFSEQTKRIAQQSVKYRMQRTTETKVRKLSRGNINNVNQNTSTVIPPSSSLSRDSQSFSKKRPWAIFTGKKTAR